ncbi:uncharacterized protein EV420DRAFT_1550981 [Desarmillaria tabescens]|uniref:F-box domain-containing protein n=1 Tax=Armillaria tabescens TaxID=1929756 RepID=A0AA39N3P5_ARMTA|nr:uncharacterized protein EV420DRAFT_1550981 [Desarmillaria tabescens]KAK0457021.1 hypothetical protein EV420DRAFT_1550981 [Desarmillaria tabescens]
MVNLVDLPTELLHTIFSNIHGENVTLNNICLVGNRTLLAIARPLTFREINIALSLPLTESHRFYSKFRSVYSNKNRRDSVKSISFRCSGFPDIKMSEILVKQLPRFAGVTHASVECEYDHLNDDGTCLSTILIPIIFKMPALESFSISACGLDDNAFSLDYSRPFLKHVRFDCVCSGPILEYAHVEGVQIIEARGDYEDYTIMQTLDGISSLSEPQQHLLNHLDLRSTPDPSDQLGIDMAQWFAELPAGSFPNLEVLVILIPIYHMFLGAILENLSVGKLKKLCIGRVSVWDTIRYVPTLPPMDDFTSLEETLLLYNGYEDSVISNLTKAPRLTHIHFFGDIDADYMGKARTYGELVETLRTVSWVNRATIGLERDDKGDIVHTEARDYEEPAWFEFGTAADGWRGKD